MAACIEEANDPDACAAWLEGEAAACFEHCGGAIEPPRECEDACHEEGAQMFADCVEGCGL